jgi:hypothetical protein
MRFLKTLTLNRRGLYDSRVALDTANTFTLADSTAMVLPKSSSSLTAVQTEGMMRYNTSTQTVEVYQGGGAAAGWRKLRYKEPGLITQQAIGTGNGTNTVFGPLNPQPATQVSTDIATWDVVQMAKNIIVIVGNVFQVSITNYVVIDGADITVTPGSAPGPYTSGQKYIQFTSSVPGAATPVVVLSGFDQ